MKSDLKGKRIGMVDPNPWPTTKPTCDTSAEINFVIHAIEPMPEARIDKKKDRFSFLDFKYGRGKGKAKSHKVTPNTSKDSP